MKDDKVKGKCKSNKAIKSEIFNVIKRKSILEGVTVGQRTKEEVIFVNAKIEKKFINFVGECLT